MKPYLKQHKLTVSFIVVFIFLFFFMGYNKLISTGPCSIHAWRQSDSYSFALTYYYGHNKLLEPEILFTGEKDNNKAVSEFPILYFITAKIWKITGVTPAVLKFIDFLLLLIGLYHLALLAKKLLNSDFWSLYVTLFLFSSPLLGYYSFNFIPNIPAFGLALTGLYYSYRFATSHKNGYLIIYTVIFSFAALIKVTALFTLLGALAVLILYYLEDFARYKFQILKVVGSFIVIFGLYYIWYKYSVNYNSKNLIGIFNQSTMPVWRMRTEKIKEIYDSFYHRVFPQYFNRFTCFILLLLIALISIFRRKINKHARRASIIYFLGFLSFAALFFQGLNYHDYFLIDTLIIFPVILLTAILTFKNLFPKLFSSEMTKVIFSLILILLLDYNMIITRSHYNPQSRLVKYNLPLTKRQTDFWDYNYYNLKISDYQYQGIDKYLRSIGVTYSDKVITLDDYTPNKTLSLMHLKGFSEYHYSWNYQNEEMIERMIALGAKYLIIRGDSNSNKPYLSEYTEHLIGKYNDINIFKLNGHQ